jgi:hypothetical protein
MNIKLILHVAVWLLLTGSFTSCADKEGFMWPSGFETVNNPEEIIIGKWKLLKSEHPMTGNSADYSQCNVVYEFGTDGILSTISTGECAYGIPLYNYPTSYPYPNYEDCFYSFVDDEEGLGWVGMPYGLQIGSFTYWYRISSKYLEINRSPSDGGIDYLVKID